MWADQASGNNENCQVVHVVDKSQPNSLVECGRSSHFSASSPCWDLFESGYFPFGCPFLSAALESPPEGPRSKSYPFLWHSKRNFPFHSRSHYNNQEFHSVLCNFGGLSGNSAIACNKFLNLKIGLRGRLIADCRNTYHLDTKTCFSLFDSFDFFRSRWFSCNGAFHF